MTNATGLNLDSHPTGLWFRNIPLNDLKWPLRLRDLHRTHFFCHDFSIAPSSKKDKVPTVDDSLPETKIVFRRPIRRRAGHSACFKKGTAGGYPVEKPMRKKKLLRPLPPG